MQDPTPPLGMPSAPPLGAAPKPKKPSGWSTWSPFGKVMAVLGIAIGSVMLIGFLGAIAAGVWLFLPGSQVDSTYAVSASSKIVARLHADVDDPGVSGVLALAARTIEEAQRAEDRAKLPENLRFLADLQGRQTKDALEMFWPRDVTVAMEPSPDGALAYAAVLNMRRFGGMVQAGFKLIAAANDEAPSEHRGHPIVEGDGMVVTHDGSSVVVASRLEDLHAVVDRIVDERAAVGSPAMMALSERLQAGHDAHAVLDAPPTFLEGLAPDAVVRAGVGADLVDEDQARGLGVVVAAPGQEDAVEAAVRAQAELMMTQWRAEGLVPEATITRESGEIRVTWRVTGLRAWMVRALGEALAEPEAVDEVTEDGALDEAALDEHLDEVLGAEEEGEGAPTTAPARNHDAPDDAPDDEPGEAVDE